MTRKLLIFGNGLGMALAPDHFLLENALRDIWSRDGILNDNQRRLISRCTGRQQAPEGEHELGKLHLAISACDALNSIGTDDIHWLTEDGQSFPLVTAKYIHKVATKLHNYSGSLPEDFVQPLLDFIRETKSHVATLNYDKLLYSVFIDNDIVGRYDTAYLIDGMTAGGLDSDSLVRLYENNFGYYLHLHGSPLFIDDNNRTMKIRRDQLSLDFQGIGHHIVLSHIDHKPSVIASSHILRIYWDYLRFALSEAEEVILFGYSGLDKHLNALIKPYLRTRQCKIVEWSGSEGDRGAFWQRELGLQPSLVPLGNILDFTDW